MNTTNTKFSELITQIARTKGSTVSVFSDFCRMSACALALQTREEEYLKISAQYDKDELELFGNALGNLIANMQESPFEDLLGSFYLEIASNFTKQDRGEFFTPPCLAELIATLLLDANEVKERNRAVSVNEPACGSGNMVLALAKTMSPDHVDLLRITCQDISPLACDMCYINTTLWGIPAKIIWGNTLTLKTWGVWRNIHWIRVGEEMRQVLLNVGNEPTFKDSPQPPIRPDEELLVSSTSQMSFQW